MERPTPSFGAAQLLKQIAETELDQVPATPEAEELLRRGYVRGAFLTPPGPNPGPTILVIEGVTQEGLDAIR